MAPKKSPSNNKGNSGGSSSSGEKITFRDARTVSHFLEVLANSTEDIIKQYDDDSDLFRLTVHLIVKCIKNYYTVEETIDELKRLDLDSSNAKTIYLTLLGYLKSTLKEEFRKLSLDASSERKKQRKDAGTAREFLDKFAVQIQQNKENNAQQEVLLKCFQRHYNIEETREELKRCCNMDASEGNIAYLKTLIKMKSKVKEEYQKLSLDAAREKNAQPLASPYNKSPQEDQENQENQQVPAKNEQSGSLSQPTDSLHAMTENINQLLVSNNKLNDQIQKAMQQMRDKSTNSEDKLKAFMTDSLINDFDRKIQKTITAKFAACGPAIGRQVVTDIEKIVASTDMQREVKKAMSQLEENLSSKVKESNESMSRQIQKLQQLMSSDLGSCKTMIQQQKPADSEHSSQLASVLSTAQSLTRELAESQKNLPAKNLEGLLKLLSEEKYEESFNWALDSNDASTISWLCSQVDLPQLPLSQVVLRKLLKELASDLRNDTSRKLTWIADVIKAIKSDFTSAHEAGPIFELVDQLLRHYLRTNSLDTSAIAGLLVSLRL